MFGSLVFFFSFSSSREVISEISPREVERKRNDEERARSPFQSAFWASSSLPPPRHMCRRKKRGVCTRPSWPLRPASPLSVFVGRVVDLVDVFLLSFLVLSSKFHNQNDIQYVSCINYMQRITVTVYLHTPYTTIRI